MHRLEVKGWKMIFQEKGTWKKAGAGILISNKVELRPKLVRRDKNGYYILKKGTTHQENKTILNVYGPNFVHPIS
jgi:hypothetical protein